MNLQEIVGGIEMIPKVIHYCWFGYGEKSALVKKCIQSWREKFPNYEIKEWNESNFDVTQNIYMKEAYECKKWAFVSDYARLQIIYTYGGIYFDTDVEVIKNFEPLIKENGYLCFENLTNEEFGQQVGTGLGFAAEAKNKVIGKMLEEYEGIHFITNGEMDLTPCPVRNTEALRKMGLITDGRMQKIENIIVYPFEYFCGYDIANSYLVNSQNTYTIHHYSATWKAKMGLIEWIKYKIVVKVIQKLIGYEKYKKLKIRKIRKKSTQ